MQSSLLYRSANRPPTPFPSKRRFSLPGCTQFPDDEASSSCHDLGLFNSGEEESLTSSTTLLPCKNSDDSLKSTRRRHTFDVIRSTENSDLYFSPTPASYKEKTDIKATLAKMTGYCKSLYEVLLPTSTTASTTTTTTANTTTTTSKPSQIATSKVLHVGWNEPMVVRVKDQGLANLNESPFF